MTKEKNEVEEKAKRVTVTMLPSIVELAKKAAKEQNRNLSNYISNLVIENTNK